jgi:UDP-N-acetylglucosamine acyltransferase
MTNIHPAAIVHPDARIAPDVEIGPYSVIGPDVELGAGTRLLHHVSVQGPCRIGARNVFHPFAIVGGDPQDLSFKGDRVTLEVGDDNVFRECVTLNRGTVKGGGVTRIGSRNLLMAYCHVAHDCVIEDEVVIANSVQLGGHIKIEHGVGIGGGTVIHHFVTIGRWAFVGGGMRIKHDIPPFMILDGCPPKVRGLNLVGLKRRGLTADRIESLKDAYKTLYRSGELRSEALRRLEKKGSHTPEAQYLIQFVKMTMQGKQGRAREASRTW